MVGGGVIRPGWEVVGVGVAPHWLGWEVVGVGVAPHWDGKW